MRLHDILDAVRDERQNQDDEWGVQNHPSTGSSTPGQRVDDYGRLADCYKEVNTDLVKAGRLGWDTILLEEVYEALAEHDPQRRVDELIQVAAVALAEVDMLMRQDFGIELPE
ncbi:hypothetical protein RHODO2019_11045 [Rhodococcus antarcticus]|uniref:Uncharacterized protein n=1 Tax=Rhodococcus antarcticus TaxID=2987751 RepID=A0ABY6NWI1_9NOCA|nr:hypothetical protein [Rhodococcus antarcticus]UZJ23742.1 hypothetical protein RHODO2019_11045 [Rhodococcus antarcticus]